MAVTVTDRRLVIDQADTTTGWTGATFGTVTTDIAESGAAVAAALNIATGQIYFTATGINLSNTLIYIYSWNSAIQLGWSTGAHALLLGDTTNQIAFHMAGQDRRAFSHSDGPVNWQSFVLDGSMASTMNTAGQTTVIAGSWANFYTSLTGGANITQYGSHFITQSKAIGGGYNVAVDIIRYGNDGIRVTAGGSGTEGNFLEIVTEDRSTSDQKAHGLIRELTTGAYGIQGPITFGNSGTATTSYFADTGIVLVYENRNIANDKYYFNVEGNSGATNYFSLIGSTISTAGPYVTCNFASGNIDTLILQNVTFTQLGNSITFSNNADATGHNITGCTFDACGQIDPGDVTFDGNSILNSASATTGAVLLDADGTSNWANLAFTSGGTGHAIYITAAGTYDFSNITFSGYSTTNPGTNSTPSSGSTDACIYNNSGGAVTINVAGGDTPTVRNGASATTVVNSNVSLSITVQDEGANPIDGAQVSAYKTSDDSTIVSPTTTNASGIVTGTAPASTGAIYIRVRQSNTADSTRYYPTSTVGTIGTGNFAVTITMIEDTTVT